MDSLYLLLPVSVLLVLTLIGLFGWAVFGGQFDDLEREGQRPLDDDAADPGAHVATTAAAPARSDTDGA